MAKTYRKEKLINFKPYSEGSDKMKRKLYERRGFITNYQYQVGGRHVDVEPVNVTYVYKPCSDCRRHSPKYSCDYGYFVPTFHKDTHIYKKTINKLARVERISDRVIRIL